MPKSKESNSLTELLKGGTIGVAVFVVMTVVSCAVLLKTNLSRDAYLPLLMVIASLSGMTGGFCAVRKRRENGLVNGLAASFIPAIIMLIAMSAAYKGFSFFELIVVACCLFGGAIGGICAVNIQKKRKPIKKR